MTIDNPVDMNELKAKSGESPQKAEGTSLQERSRTLGDIEGSASSSLKVVGTSFSLCNNEACTFGFKIILYFMISV